MERQSFAWRTETLFCLFSSIFFCTDGNKTNPPSNLDVTLKDFVLLNMFYPSLLPSKQITDNSIELSVAKLHPIVSRSPCPSYLLTVLLSRSLSAFLYILDFKIFVKFVFLSLAVFCIFCLVRFFVCLFNFQGKMSSINKFRLDSWQKSFASFCFFLRDWIWGKTNQN